MVTAETAVEIALRKILVATDFSECSERALQRALGVARHYGSTVYLAHVVQPAAYYLGPPESYTGMDALCTAVDLAQRDLESLAAKLVAEHKLDGERQRVCVSQGYVWPRLRAIIERERIDLVVLGTHGRTGWRKLLMGSIAEEVFRNCKVPVLTVGPQSKADKQDEARLQQVLFATDLSPESAHALPHAVSAAREFGATLHVVHVVELLDPEAVVDHERVRSALLARLREMLGPVEWQANVELAVEFGPAAEMIVQYGERTGADVIVLGLKAPDTVRDRVPWLHAYKIVCEAPCPVLTVRSAGVFRD